MSEDHEAGQAGEAHERDAIVTRQISPDSDSSEYEFLQVIAELEGTDVTDLPSLYREVDHMVEVLFDTPPSAEAQISLSFSYAGYRITMDQTGALEVVEVKETA